MSVKKHPNYKNRNITVACIGAGREQAPIIELAKSLGLRVVAVDGDKHALGSAVADSFEVIDLNDVAGVLDWAQSQAPRAVLPTPLGSALTTVGAVNDALKLTGITKVAAVRCVNKQQFHSVMRSAGVSVPIQISAKNLDEVLGAAKSIGYPVVVKPQKGSGSRGVFVASSVDELKTLYIRHQSSFNNSANAEQLSIVQEFVYGHEVGVDGAVIDGGFHIFLIRDKLLTSLPYRVGIGYLTPTILSSNQQERVETALVKAAYGVGLDNCLYHADVIVPNMGEPVVVEMAGRPSGYNLCLRMVQAVTGLNPITVMLDHLLGKKARLATKFSKTRGGVLRMVESSPGVVRRIQGMENALNVPDVVAGELYLTPGSRVFSRIDGPSSFIGYLLVASEDRGKAEAQWNQAARQIIIESEQAF